MGRHGRSACWRSLAPRPLSLTAVRVVAPAFAVVAVIAVVDGTPSTLAAIGAVVATVVALVLVSSHDLALAAANALAYGDEQRVLLRTPPALFLGPAPRGAPGARDGGAARRCCSWPTSSGSSV